MAAVPAWASLAEGRGPTLAWDLLPIVWAVAAATWAVTVVPLALLGDHRSGFFRPSSAPAVGAACGALALLAAWSLWFLAPPWVFLLPPYQWDYLGAFPVAAVMGAVIWTVYARAAPRLSGRSEDLTPRLRKE